MPSKAISAAPSIIDPRENASLPFEAANISVLNKKSGAISYNKETETNRSSQQEFDMGFRVEGGAYLNETSVDQNTGTDRVHSAADNRGGGSSGVVSRPDT